MSGPNPNFYFESISAGEPYSADPAGAPSQVPRGAPAGSQFQSLLPEGISPAVAKFRPPTDAAAGNNSNPRAASRASAPAVACEPVAPRANPYAAAGNEYRFGSGPVTTSPGRLEQGRARNRVTDAAAAKSNLKHLCAASGAFPSPSRAFLKLSQIAQALLDILKLGLLLLFVTITALAIVAGVVILLFVRL